MKRLISIPFGALSIALLSLALAAPARAQPWDNGYRPPPRDSYPRRDYAPPPRDYPPPDYDYGPDRVPDISGLWYNRANGGEAQIIQRRLDGRALFINEKGDRAWGTVEGDRVWIPDWQDGYGRYGLRGQIRGNRIVWPDGNYWYR
jgi:hypothetical protein